MRDPAAAKLLSPNVLCVRGTPHDLSVDEHSRRRRPNEYRQSSMEVPGWTMTRKQSVSV